MPPMDNNNVDNNVIIVDNLTTNTTMDNNADEENQIILPSRKRPRLLPISFNKKKLLSSSSSIINNTNVVTPNNVTTTNNNNNNNNTNKNINIQNIKDDNIRANKLRNPLKRNIILNELLQLTSNYEINFSMSSDIILKELINICIYDCFNWNNNNNNNIDNDNNYYTNDNDEINLKFHSKLTWIKPPTKRMMKWIQHCSTVFNNNNNNNNDITDTAKTINNTNIMTKDEKLKTLEVIIVIIRNLSYVGANLCLLVYTPELLCLLIGCMCCENNIINDNNDYNDYIDIDNNNNSLIINYSNTDNNTVSSHISTITLTAIQTLFNLTKYIDVTGQLILCDKLFHNENFIETIKTSTTSCPILPNSNYNNNNNNNYNNTDYYGICNKGIFGFGSMYLARKLDNKEDTISNITQELLFSLTSNYLIAVYSIFPILYKLLISNTTSRNIILSILDILQELINKARIGIVGDVKDEIDIDDNKDNYIDLYSLSASDLPTLRSILVNMPDSMLTKLIELLYIPRVGPDSLDYIDPVNNIVPRVTPLKLLIGYDLTIDTDARDRSLEILVPLLELDSPKMAIRIGTILEKNSIIHNKDEKNQQQQVLTEQSRIMRKCIFDSLMPILTTTVGRNDASILAIQILRELSKAISINEQIKIGFDYIQEKLIVLASNDQRISHLVFNDLYYIPDNIDNNEDAEHGEEEYDEDNNDTEIDNGEYDESNPNQYEYDNEGEESE